MRPFLKSLNRRTEVTGNKSIEKFKGTALKGTMRLSSPSQKVSIIHKSMHAMQKTNQCSSSYSHSTSASTYATIIPLFFSSPYSSLPPVLCKTQPIEPKKFTKALHTLTVPLIIHDKKSAPMRN